MTREEIKAKSVATEIEKLEMRKAKAEARLEKKEAAAEKLGMNITQERFFEIRDNVSQEQYGVYFDLSIARDDLEEIERRIEKLTKSLEKHTTAVARQREAISAEEAERRTAEEIKAWAKDGITVKVMSANYIKGTTPKGEFFSIEINHGVTERSRHCFTLQIGKETVFTSGELYRAYAAVKRS